MEIIVKKHITPKGLLMLAACDNEILGKRFEEGNSQLDLTSNFFNGEKTNSEEFILLLKKAYTITIAGNNCINIAINEKLLPKEKIKFIQKIPHAIIINCDE